MLERDFWPDAGTGATHTGRAPALTGFVTGTTRVLDGGVDADLVAASEAPEGPDDELGDAAVVVDAVLPAWVVCVRDTVFVPADGHTGSAA
ncbi:hypothetical protein [Streptomyces sp. NPDC090083]|uniref:hypothetical protein n=1 Tax=Streptomyces sp. NPDC090083 TaxID=3365941 RepID=UPI00382585B1